MLVVAAWLLCSFGVAGAAVMVLNKAAHPLAEQDAWEEWLVYLLPYVLLAASAWLARRRGGILVTLVIVTAVSAVMLTWACYQAMELSLFMLDSRSAGRRGLVCGPPMAVFVVPLVYLMALGAVAMGLKRPQSGMRP